MHSGLWSSEFRDALPAGYDLGRLEEYLEVVDLEAVNGRRTRCWDSIHRLVDAKLWARDEVNLPLKLFWRTGWWQSICRAVRRKLKLHSGVNSKSRESRDRNYLVYAVLGVCCTRRMLHSVLTHPDGMERYRGMTLLCVLAMMVELWTRKTGMGDEDENNMEDTSRPENSGVQRAWFGFEDPVLVLLRAGSGLVPAVSGMVNWLAHEFL